ncbi:hypothetical protein N0V88_002841 [Collariella sp. IMI 366227]|nr:hypothetical protein N0V88_002841 [Collariella sp. IMI 366227]
MNRLLRTVSPLDRGLAKGRLTMSTLASGSTTTQPPKLNPDLFPSTTTPFPATTPCPRASKQPPPPSQPSPSSKPSSTDLTLARALISAWRRDGIIQIAMSPPSIPWCEAQAASRAFFARPHSEKTACVDERSYSGYIASGEEMTNEIADYSEIFTVTKDLEFGDERRVMGRFPARNATNGKGKEGRGIGSHTDYGLLVIAAQDDVGGYEYNYWINSFKPALFIRRPHQEEQFANWEKSAAGLREDDDGWVYVPPVDGAHTVILGDMMQYLTRNYLTATPHKVGLNTRERFSIAYFHEPSFQAVLKPLEGGCGGLTSDLAQNVDSIHYGTHFTNMFMRNYPDRITTQRLVAEGRYGLLKLPELRTMGTAA